MFRQSYFELIDKAIKNSVIQNDAGIKDLLEKIKVFDKKQFYKKDNNQAANKFFTLIDELRAALADLKPHVFSNAHEEKTWKEILEGLEKNKEEICKTYRLQTSELSR